MRLFWIFACPISVLITTQIVYLYWVSTTHVFGAKQSTTQVFGATQAPNFQRPSGLLKIIHQQYKTSNVSEFPYLTWVSFQERWKQVHPGWTHHMWTDRAEEEMIAAELPQLLPTYKAINETCSKVYFIMRADIASYVILYVHGGVYADMDSVPITPIDDTILDGPSQWFSGWRAPQKRVSVVLPAQERPYTVDNDLMIAAQARHGFFHGCIESIRRFFVRHREFVCSLVPPPMGSRHELEPYFPLLWFGASRRLLMCIGAWRGPEAGMDLEKIAAWEDGLAEAHRLLASSPAAARKAFGRVRDEVYARRWTASSDLSIPVNVGKEAADKAEAEARCAGECASVLDGAQPRVVDCMTQEAARRGSDERVRSPKFVLFDGADSSWEDTHVRRSRCLLTSLRRENPGFWALLGACRPEAGGLQSPYTTTPYSTTHSCREACEAAPGCVAFDVPMVEGPGQSCHMFDAGPHEGNDESKRFCFVRVTSPLQGLDPKPFHLAPLRLDTDVLATAQAYPSICFVHYHKTGSDLAEGLAGALGDATKKDYRNLNVAFNSWSSRNRGRYSEGDPAQWHDWSKHSAMNLEGLDRLLPFADANPGVFSATEPLPAQIQNTAVVHFLRHPVDQMVSAYHYHCERREYWVSEEGRCNFCAQADWLAIFSRCGFSCNYGDVLQAANETEGIALEFRNQHLTVNTMLANMQIWWDDPKVLSVSLAQFQADFHGTVACLARFLRLPPRVRDDLQARSARHDLASKRGALSARQASHATNGRYSEEAKASLRNALARSGAFGGQLPAISSLYAALLERGARLYGCPRVELHAWGGAATTP